MNYLNKTIEYGLYMLALTLPIQTRLILKAGELNGKYFEYGTVSLYAVDILLAGIIALFFLKQFKYKHQSPNSNHQINFKLKILNPIFFLALFVFSALVSIFFAQDKILASYVSIRLLFGVGLFFVLIKAQYNVVKLAYFFLSGIFFHASLGIWQFLVQMGYPSKWLGIAAHDPRELGVSVIEFADQRWLRAYGGLDHPNILGGLLVIGLSLLLLLAVKLPIFDKEKDGVAPSRQSKIQFSFYLLVFTFSSALFFSFSRNAWLGFVAGWIVLFLSVIFKKVERKKILEISAVIVSLLLMLFYFYGDLVRTRLANSSRLEKMSTEERVGDYRNFKGIVKENWLFGVGAGNYAFVVNEKIQAKPGSLNQPIHNAFALIWVEAGLLSILNLLGLIGALLYQAIKEKKVYVFLLLPVFMMMFGDHWWWSLHFGVTLFWFLVGYFFRLSQE